MSGQSIHSGGTPDSKLLEMVELGKSAR
jgi:hypothetical protein